MPFVYQALRCSEYRRAADSSLCAVPCCQACYGDDAVEVPSCGEYDSETGMSCQLPANAPEKYHSYMITFD